MGGIQPVPELDKQAYELWQEHGSYDLASKASGIAKSTLLYRSRRHKKRIDADAPAPDGYKVKGTSTLYNKEGEVVAQWVKTTLDHERQVEMLKAVVDGLKGEFDPEKPNPAKPICHSDLASLYVITDYHLGQLSWADETGADWNLDIAENMLVDWFAAAIQAAPASKTAIFGQLGDFLHFDSLMPVTPTSKHVLDASARYPQMVRVAIRAIRRIVAMLLEKHEHVHIIMAYGNHDLASSVWLREMLSDKYSDEPRVTVDNSATPYYAYEHGLTSLFFHHGHKKKLGEISKTFAGQYREIFGRTKYSYAHMGHLHHVHVKEDSMMIVEQHPTLAAKDAHSADGGYHSLRGASVITYHKEAGEVARATIRPEMLK